MSLLKMKEEMKHFEKIWQKIFWFKITVFELKCQKRPKAPIFKLNLSFQISRLIFSRCQFYKTFLFIFIYKSLFIVTDVEAKYDAYNCKVFQPSLKFLGIAYPSGAPYGVIFVHNKCLKTAKKKFYRGKHSSLFSVEEKKSFLKLRSQKISLFYLNPDRRKRSRVGVIKLFTAVIYECL